LPLVTGQITHPSERQPRGHGGAWSRRSTPREIGRGLSAAENADTALESIVVPPSGHAHVVGITGPAGAGKSTLVDKLIDEARAESLRVAVIAVDPSSPYSGGAILGDRVRMNRHAGDSGVFIRSMAARHALGGLAAATRDAINILDACEYDLILVETVGVGQSEIEIVRSADTVVVLVAPGLGDSVQTLKAGVLEIADVLVVNMADRPGAGQTTAELRVMLTLGERADKSWGVPIVETIATDGTGLETLWQTIVRHHQVSQRSGALLERRAMHAEAHVLDLVLTQMRQRFDRAVREQAALGDTIATVRSGQLDAHRAARIIVDRWFGERTSTR
jgi:LAO/AO transport system kinase